MKFKSYFAGTVEAAMALAREELGPEAMLVQSKRTTAETRRMGQYEVVFALAPAEPAVAATRTPEPAPSFAQVFASERDSAIDKLSAEIAQLKQRIEGISAMPAAPASFTEKFFIAEAAPAEPAGDARVRDTIQRLVALDVDPAIAAEIAGTAGNGIENLREAVRARVRVDASLGVANASRTVVALAGPPGAGKTTALVKLATRYGVAARRSVHLISTDVFRVGAAEQLRLYASILGVGFQTIETPLALAQALEEQRRRDLVLIDTPGWVQRDLPEIRELAAYMAEDPEIDVHLVLPASNRACDLVRAVDRYAIFRPSKLIFTRLDETERYGPLINQTGTPVSYLCAGEQIPEDLEPATVDGITEMLLGKYSRSEFENVQLEEAH